MINLTHFSPVSHFYTPWKRQKTLRWSRNFTPKISVPFIQRKVWVWSFTLFIQKLPLEVFSKKQLFSKILQNFLEHVCRNLSFSKVAFLKRATLLKKRLCHWCFPLNFAKFWRTPSTPPGDCFWIGYNLIYTNYYHQES